MALGFRLKSAKEQNAAVLSAKKGWKIFKREIHRKFLKNI